MDEEVVKTSEKTIENEIEIKLEETDDEKNIKANHETDNLTIEPQTFKTIEPKNVGELTDDERAIIIANAKNGINQPNFDVKFFRNGKFRIVRKKEKPPTISEKVVKTQDIPTTDKKAYYTDNQLLFEHIIELNAKVDKLMNKHKKLKRKYQTLQNDIYIDDEDIETVNASTINEPVNESNSEPVNEPINEQPNIRSIRQYTPTATTTRLNWRSQLRYL